MTIELEPEHVGRLGAFLGPVLGDGGPVQVVSAVRPSGGLSWDTFVIEVAGPGLPVPRRVVLRRAPRTGPLAPYDVEREASLLAALGPTPVRAPPLLAHSTSTGVVGRPFLVSDYIPGEAPDLRRVETWPVWRDLGRRSELTQEILSCLGSIQAVDLAGCRGPTSSPQADDPATGLRRDADRLMASLERDVYPRFAPLAGIRDAQLWLKREAEVVAGDDAVLVHGDFRYGNFIWQGTTLAAVIDWERAAVGHPMADLGFMCMRISRQRRPELMAMTAPADQLLCGYQKVTGRAADARKVHLYAIYWQLVEATMAPRGLALLAEDPTFRPAFTVYPQLNMATRFLIEDIERYERGDYLRDPLMSTGEDASVNPEETLRRLVDEREITGLLHACCRLVDRRAFDELGQLFADDAVANYVGPELHGRQAIVEFIKGSLAPVEATHHQLGNVEIFFDDPDHASTLSYATAWHAFADGTELTLHGTYRDRLRRTAEGWRLTERRPKGSRHETAKLLAAFGQET